MSTTTRAPHPLQPTGPWPERVRIDGLSGPVEIRRGRHGVPLVHAGDLTDAICGLGYAVGRDRLFQLDLMRRQAAGRLAELFGPDRVAGDTHQRRLGLSDAAVQALAGLPTEQLALVRAYTAGVNAAIDDSSAPYEYTLLGADRVDPWRPEDSMLVALLVAQMLTGDGGTRRMRDVMERTLPAEICGLLLSDADPYLTDSAGAQAEPRRADLPVDALRRLLGETGSTRPSAGRRVVAADSSPWGSNAVAVAGRNTPDGRAVMAGDMHLPLTAPALLHRAGLRWGDARVDGVTVPGIPTFAAGASADLAWGATRLAADTIDLVEVDISPEDPDRYRSADGWKQVTVGTARIEVRGASPVTVETRHSEWGPLVGPPLDGRPLALRWTALEPGGMDLGLTGLMTAKDVTEACDVVRSAGGPSLNIVVADRSGRIGWAVSGAHPARAEQAPRGVVRPREGQNSWNARLPGSRLPGVIDPPGGLIVNANNRMADHLRAAVGDNHFSARRAARLGELLADGKVSEADLFRMQNDQDAGFYRFYQDLAREALSSRARAGRPDRQSLYDGIGRWDGTASPDSLGLAALVVFRELVRESWFSALLAPCVQADPEFRYCWHSHEAPLRALLESAEPDLVPPPHRDRESFLLAELDLSVLLLGQLVPDKPAGEVRWGGVSPAGVRHPLSAALPELSVLLDMPPDAPGGCPESVCATQPGFGPAVRLVASPAYPEAALVSLPGGQSGNPADPTYRDQYDAWLRGIPLPMVEDGHGRAATTLLEPPRVKKEA